MITYKEGPGPMTMRLLIADGDGPSRERVRSLLETVPDAVVIGECLDGGQVVDAIRTLRPTLVLLDAGLPALHGSELVRALGRENMPPLVMLGTEESGVGTALDLGAVAYLLKPCDPEGLRAVLEQARGRSVAAAERIERKLDLLIDRVTGARARRFVVRTGARLKIVPVDAVDWIQAEGNYARLHVGRTSHLVRQTMKALEESLSPTEFVRIHRSTIVRIDAVAELESVFQGEYSVILRDGTKLTSSSTYRESLEQAIAGEWEPLSISDSVRPARDTVWVPSFGRSV